MERQHGIRLELVWRDADVFEVSVYARNASFSGNVCVYVSAEQLRELAETVRGFQKTPSDTRRVTLGGFGPQWAGGAASMHFFCEDSVGHSFAEVQMESGQGISAMVESCHLLVSIAASGIDEFVPQLLALASFNGNGRLGPRPAAALPAWYPSTEEMLREDRAR